MASRGEAPSQHRLKHAFAMWVAPRTSNVFAQNYQQHLVKMATFSTVEEFWRYYSWIIRPSSMTINCDFHLFKDSVRPIWEDEANQKGGKWEIHLRKGVASRCFEDVILAVLGDQFRVGDEICGVVVSIKTHDDMISVWNRSADDKDVIMSIRDTLKQVLNVPSNAAFEYHAHVSKLAQHQSTKSSSRH
ncbi:mRNA cap-binding protein [Plasmodiophora brassicae]|uniref:mRNA cap-binding protein n=1 Tax=Plasmodiophora brassicae TaxID=37360 RepID=A0A0G4J338_PLABS|nr:hypothetical protein PBRA_002328 [Plasmodiophora brassicae]SPQ98918.1 unnamed protein product [Plasmodiophora brassicae]